MTSNCQTFGLVLFFSLAAVLFSLPVSSRADELDDSPQWCTKAKTKVEKLICKDEQVGYSDEELGVYYETLLRMVEPSTKSGLVRSQRRWIAEREQCGATAKEAEDLATCVYTKIQQRSDLLRKDIAEKNIEKRLSEFNKSELRTFKDTAFEFQYPRSWQRAREDGRVSLKSQGEVMILGFDRTVTSSKECTYSEGREFYSGKKQIGGREFENFSRGWIPNGHDEHYYDFFNGGCFAIDVSDEGSPICSRFDGKGRANCEITGLEAKDVMAYSDAVMRTLHFLSNKN